jgi:hypothetical protein
LDWGTTFCKKNGKDGKNPGDLIFGLEMILGHHFLQKNGKVGKYPG